MIKGRGQGRRGKGILFSLLPFSLSSFKTYAVPTDDPGVAQTGPEARREDIA
jgi:hypothetical protein